MSIAAAAHVLSASLLDGQRRAIGWRTLVGLSGALAAALAVLGGGADWDWRSAFRRGRRAAAPAAGTALSAFFLVLPLRDRRGRVGFARESGGLRASALRARGSRLVDVGSCSALGLCCSRPTGCIFFSWLGNAEKKKKNVRDCGYSLITA